jgi:hypothetical protein
MTTNISLSEKQYLVVNPSGGSMPRRIDWLTVTFIRLASGAEVKNASILTLTISCLVEMLIKNGQLLYK